MKNQQLRRSWVYGLLLIPVISAILAVRFHDFGYKSGVAGGGILILLLLYFTRLKQTKDVWMIIGAFLFSIAGDWFLSNRHGHVGMFVAGIALFFFAHVGYLSYALFNGRMNRNFTLVLLVGYLLFFLLILYPSIDNQLLMGATLIYLLISCFSLGAATGIKGETIEKWAYVFGIIMVLFSDTIIAFKEFAGYKQMGFLILPTYYLAQISVTFSLIRKYLSL